MQQRDKSYIVLFIVLSHFLIASEPILIQKIP